jgi:hypothetical protein
MDGSNAWHPGVAEQLKYYVYLLIDPRDQQVFYVGKGQGDRCFQHVVEARKTTADSAGDYPKLVRIRDIERAGLQVTIELLRHGLEDEQTAFAVEAAAIDLLGRIYSQEASFVDPSWARVLDVRIHGQARGKGLTLVDEANSAYGARVVEFDPSHRIMLVRVARQFHPGIGDEALYKATREWWKIARYRRDGGRHSPQWAFAVYRGVIRAVYRIDQWVGPTEEELVAAPTIKNRWAFNGVLDSEMSNRYLFADVTQWLPQSAQNPIRYVNCGTGPDGEAPGTAV